MASKREAWLSLLPADPRPLLLASAELLRDMITGEAGGDG